MTRDVETNQITRYLDGKAYYSSVKDIGSCINSNEIYLMQRGYHNVYASGEMDDLMIWDIALTKEQIQSSMDNPLENEYESNLQGYWNFDNGEGDILYDTSGNDNHGIIDGATWIDVQNIAGCTDSLAGNYNPDAEYLISETEYKWWLTQDRIEKVEENFVTIVLGAQNSLLALPEITLINGTKDLSHGITAIPTIGHTPGHNSILVNSNGMSLIISGDALIDPQISFKAPHWTNDTDMDSDMTVTSRKQLLAMAVSEQSTILGYHFPFPGVGHAITHENSYEFVPIPVYG